jgi:hypothetical protein
MGFSFFENYTGNEAVFQNFRAQGVPPALLTVNILFGYYEDRNVGKRTEIRLSEDPLPPLLCPFPHAVFPGPSFPPAAPIYSGLRLLFFCIFLQGRFSGPHIGPVGF